MSAVERRPAATERVTERVIVMDADAASRRAAELAEEATAAREVPTAPATGVPGDRPRCQPAGGGDRRRRG